MMLDQEYISWLLSWYERRHRDTSLWPSTVNGSLSRETPVILLRFLFWMSPQRSVYWTLPCSYCTDVKLRDINTIHPHWVVWGRGHLKIEKSFYYEPQTKRELQGIHLCGCRWNERLKSKTDGSTRLTYTGLVGRKFGNIMIFVFITTELKMILYWFITTDKAKPSRGGGKVSVLWRTNISILRKLKTLTH